MLPSCSISLELYLGKVNSIDISAIAYPIFDSCVAIILCSFDANTRKLMIFYVFDETCRCCITWYKIRRSPVLDRHVLSLNRCGKCLRQMENHKRKPP